MNFKIPKKIFYCWFGGNPLPKFAQDCIASWRKYCPDYEIIEINESNFDFNFCRYSREAYEAGKWAFVSDVARLYVLVNNGGIYLDTDVELKKSLNELLTNEAVCGFESNNSIGTAIVMCRKEHPLFLEMLESYTDAVFVKANGEYNTTTNVTRLTNLLLKYGMTPDNSMQTITNVLLLPSEYFSPKDFFTKKINITENTIAVHHFDGSWMSEEGKLTFELTNKYKKILPSKIAGYYAKFVSVKKYRGRKSAIKEIIAWLKRKR